MAEPSKTLQTIWAAAGQASTFLLGIVSSMVLARYLAKVDLATFRQVAYVHGTLTVVFAAGLPRVYSYFLPRNPTEAGPAIINKTMGALAVLGAIFSTTLYLGSGLIASALSNPLLAEAIRAFAPVPLFLFPVMGIDGILATWKRTDSLAIYLFSSRLLTLTCILSPIILFEGNYIDAIHGWLVASILSFCLAIWFQRAPYKNIRAARTSVGYSEIFKYSIPLVFASIWGTLIVAADQYFVSRYFGPQEFAGYSLAMIEVPIVTMITTATSTVLFPYFSKAALDKSLADEMFAVWRSALERSALFVYPTVIFCMLFATEIITFLYSSQYAGAANYFRIAMTTNFFNIIVFAPLLLSLGKTRLYATVHMVAAVMIYAVMYLSVLVHPTAHGIAIIRVSTIAAIVIFFMSHIARHFSVAFWVLIPYRQLALIVAASMCAGLASLAVVDLAGLNGALPRLLVSGPVFLVTLLAIERRFKLGLREILTPVVGEIARRRLK